MAFHEGKACGGVIFVLEAREGRSRRDVRWPDKDGDPAPIELTRRIAERLFALEHTVSFLPIDGIGVHRLW